MHLFSLKGTNFIVASYQIYSSLDFISNFTLLNIINMDHSDEYSFCAAAIICLILADIIAASWCQEYLISKEVY